MSSFVVDRICVFLHLAVDGFFDRQERIRRMVVSTYVETCPDLSDDPRSQFLLAFQVAGWLAPIRR